MAAYHNSCHTQLTGLVNPTTQTLLERRWECLLRIITPPQKNHSAANIYPTLCYGDLDGELDFPSCEISFCSPAGQPHHYAIPRCRLPSLHKCSLCLFRSTRSLSRLQHLASCHMLLSTSLVDWEETVSSARHFVGSALAQMRKNGTLSPSREALQSKPLWRAEIHHVFMKMNQAQRI